MSDDRIHLLSEVEIETLYAFPEFNAHEQSLYFEFTDREKKRAKQYRTIKAQLYFMLMLGYFKAKQQFYLPDLHSPDAHYIFEKYFDKNGMHLSGKVDEKTYRKQREDILLLLGYQAWSSSLEPQIHLQLSELLRYYPKTHSALRQLLTYFSHQKIMLPGYRVLQDIFTTALSIEENRLHNLVLSLPKPLQEKLSALIGYKDSISPLNNLRADQKDFQPSVPGAVRQNSGKLREVCRGLIMQGKLVLCQSITYKIKFQMNQAVC